jgi:glutathione peroxidase
MNIYQFKATDINGKEVSLETYKNKVLLIVNTASKCGFTPQFEALEALYQKYGKEGFVVLGFPCNQFGNQDPGSSSEILSFCQINYGVSFPMFQKVDVNGENTHPIFDFLKTNSKAFGGKSIKWNFTKFLVGKDGMVFKRYAPTILPLNMSSDIELLLKK